MFRKRNCAIAMLAILVLMSSAAFAQLKSQLKSEKVVVTGGKETLVAADNAAPGDVIEYTADYSNSGKTAVSNVKANLPVPKGTVFIAGSAIPAELLASTDGKNFAKFPLKRTVKAPDGTVIEKEVPLSEYVALRWDLGTIAPGASKSVKARVRVSR